MLDFDLPLEFVIHPGEGHRFWLESPSPSKGWDHQHQKPGKQASTNLQPEFENHAPAASGEDSKTAQPKEKVKHIEQQILPSSTGLFMPLLTHETTVNSVFHLQLHKYNQCITDILSLNYVSANRTVNMCVVALKGRVPTSL